MDDKKCYAEIKNILKAKRSVLQALKPSLCSTDNVACLMQKVKNSDVPQKSQHNCTDKHVCFAELKGSCFVFADSII